MTKATPSMSRDTPALARIDPGLALELRGISKSFGPVRALSDVTFQVRAGEVHALAFPCRRVLRGWVNSQTGAPVHVFPTHWREWSGLLEEAPIGEPEQERLAIVEGYSDDLRAIIQREK